MKTVGCLRSADNDAPVTPTDTKVSTDTIVQLFRLRASGLIASVHRIGSIEDRDNFAKEKLTVIFKKRLYTAKVHAAGRETIVRALCGLVLIGIITTLGYSQEMASDYVSPSEAVPRGKAPKMRVQLLNPGEATKQYAVIFYQGDEAFSGLLEFAEKYQVTSAHFTAIGAVSGATLGWFDPQRKMYKKIPIDGQHEVIGMIGDIALYQGKPAVHTHMAVGGPDGTTRAGHVLAAYASPTLEVMVTVDPITMRKRLDAATDLTLIDPASK